MFWRESLVGTNLRSLTLPACPNRGRILSPDALAAFIVVAAGQGQAGGRGEHARPRPAGVVRRAVVGRPRPARRRPGCTITVYKVKEAIRIVHNAGTARIDFDDLSADLQTKYGWTAEKSAVRLNTLKEAQDRQRTAAEAQLKAQKENAAADALAAEEIILKKLAEKAQQDILKRKKKVP